jgi:NAD(P)H-dependent flavin oxidoreductase YrpB (nitropropane dioxygenase family)
VPRRRRPGVVLDSQILLTRESPLPESLRKRVGGLDGGETLVLGARLGEGYRVYARPDCAGAQELAKEDERLQHAALSAEEKLSAWRDAVRARVAADPAAGVWLVGQDVASAAPLAAKGVTVSGVIQTVCARAVQAAETSRKLRHLGPDAPLAKSHGTKYPILQGPMTRVSDTAAFADSVAAGGALPFLALALLRKAETDKLLAETKAKLGAKPWGVGILGFVPNEIRAEQFEAIKTHKPPFAIIAGGRPDQARQLEALGIPTYLHVPAPGLLKMFLKDGARRFIFEGQECGGHIGPRTSFALWEAMVEVLLEYIGNRPADDLHVVFAGGIHDGLSAGMVAALSAPLADKGVKVGVLIGTAYLFTEEAVKGGAITARFQQEALACGDTVLLETGPRARHPLHPDALRRGVRGREAQAEGRRQVPPRSGDRAGAHEPRAAFGSRARAWIVLRPPRLAARRRRARRRRQRRARRHERRRPLAGSRRRAVRARHVHDRAGGGPCGTASPRSPSCTRASATASSSRSRRPCCTSSRRRRRRATSPSSGCRASTRAPPRCGATGRTSSPSRTRSSRSRGRTGTGGRTTTPTPRARDKMVSKWGGFMSDITFDPLKYGITPKSLPNIEPLQLLLLEAVNQALGDAGYLGAPVRPRAHLRHLGRGRRRDAAVGRLRVPRVYAAARQHPGRAGEVAADRGPRRRHPARVDRGLVPGILLNVAAGRVANRFNLGGPNMAIDAACGSSLRALYAGVRELRTTPATSPS